MEQTSGAYIVSWDFSDEDSGVLIVGKQTKGTMEIVNAFQDEEAYELYKKLSTVKKAET
jgi:hypothetical protein